MPYKNKEQQKNYLKNWRMKNPDYSKKYIRNHRDKYNFFRKRWMKENPDKVREYWQIDNANKKAKLFVGGRIGVKDWREIKRKSNFTCLSCNAKEPEIKLTIDHIVSFTKGGINNKENIQALCSMCNCRKR